MKKLWLVLLVSVVLVSLVACGEEYVPTAEEIMAGVTENQQYIESYRFDMDMTTNMTIIEDDLEGAVPENINISGTVAGATDIVDYKMKMEIDFGIAGPDEDPISMEMDMYMVDEMMYMMMDMPLMPAQWIKFDIPEYPEYDQDQMDMADVQIKILEAIDIEFIGSEKVNDRDCYILEIIPDMDEIWSIVMEQAQMSIEEMPEFPIENLSDMFKNISMKMWVTKDIYLVTKSNVDILIEMTGETLGMPGEEGGFSINASGSIMMYDYNQPVVIELPPEAEDAVYQPMY